jgi:hypothetical protein
MLVSVIANQLMEQVDWSYPKIWSRNLNKESCYNCKKTRCMTKWFYNGLVRATGWSHLSDHTHS